MAYLVLLRLAVFILALLSRKTHEVPVVLSASAGSLELTDMMTVFVRCCPTMQVRNLASCCEYVEDGEVEVGRYTKTRLPVRPHEARLPHSSAQFLGAPAARRFWPAAFTALNNSSQVHASLLSSSFPNIIYVLVLLLHALYCRYTACSSIS